MKSLFRDFILALCGILLGYSIGFSAKADERQFIPAVMKYSQEVEFLCKPTVRSVTFYFNDFDSMAVVVFDHGFSLYGPWLKDNSDCQPYRVHRAVRINYTLGMQISAAARILPSTDQETE